jgi:hypothetical protein
MEQRNQVSQSNKMSSRPNPNPLDLKPGYLNWWQSLLLAFSCTLAGLIAAYSAMSGVSMGSGDMSAASWGKDLLKLTPHALLLFGLMADAITYNGVYWSSTIVGLSAAGLHGMLETITNSFVALMQNIGKNITGATPAPTAAPQQGGAFKMSGGGDYNGCTVTGAEGIAPDHRTAQTMVVTVSVIAYFFFDLWLNRGIINSLGTLVVGILLLIGQAMAITPTCFPPEDKDKRTITSGVVYALLFGTLIGGGFYSFFQSFYPMYLPSTVIPLQSYASQVASISSTGFVYVPGVGLVSVSSPEGQQALANGTAMSPDDMSTALDATGTLGTGKAGEETKCS